MKKRKIWLLILMFVLFTASAASAAGFLRVNMLTARADSIERRITPEGEVYEIISTENRLCLRKMDADGLVTGYYPLPVSEERGMRTAYHIVGVLDEEMYLYKYETSGNTPVRRGETVLAYNMTTGKSRIAAEIEAPGTLDVFDVFFAQNTSESAVFFGYLSREERILTLRRVGAAGGETEDLFAVYTPFPLAAISVAKTGELFALSQDSFVYMLKDGGWICLYEPRPHEAAANMTVGEGGDVYLFLTAPDSTRVMVSTPQNREFAAMDFDTADLIMLHIAEKDRWVGMDSQYRYVICTGAGKYTTGTLRASFPALWDTDSVLIVIFCAAAATGLFAVIRKIAVNRRLHLLPKLLIIIIPVFTLGMYALVSIADGYVMEITETGLRESILEYAYDTIDEIDAGRFAGIDWSAPFEDEYYIELRALLYNLSGYRIMEVRNQEENDTHNAYVSFWAYRIDGGKIYTAIGGHYVTGLEVKYLEYNAQIAQREEMMARREPISTHLLGMDSGIRWTAVLFPITAGDELAGYLEVARPLTAIDEAVYTVTHSIFLAGLFVFAAVITTLVSLLAFSTKTLGKLRRGAQAVSGGEYSARVHSKSWDETGEIACAFNAMAQSVETSIREITEVSNGYSKFVSDKLIELLGKEKISGIKPGDYKRLTATHLLLYTDSFDKLRDKEFFDALGRFYDNVIPGIASVGGLISGHSARGLAAMLEKPPETALRAVLAVFAALDRAGGIPCYVFMSYSGAMLGVIGNGEHLNMITVSRLVYESHSIGTAGKRFGTRLIVSQSAFDEMGEHSHSGHYNYRFLGFMRIEGELRRLYDFYDCDIAEIKVKKNMTRERFEKGVELYYAGEYSKAQKTFVEIIKEFPEDMASREFLRRSHEGLKSAGAPNMVIELI